jgi:Ion transport protein
MSLFRSACGKFVNSNAVQWLVVLMIIANAIMMGVATFDFVEKSTEISEAFETADFVFLVLFSIELLLQFIAHGVVGVLSNGWLCFDTIIIVASWSLAHLQVARAIRIIRAIRIATRLEALRSILRALITVSPSVAAIMALLLLGTYWITG